MIVKVGDEGMKEEMAQLKKKSSGNNPTGKASDSKAIDRARKGRRTAFIIASVVITLILAIVGVSLYINAAPFRRVIVTVGGTSINMDYFLRRTRLAGLSPMEMLGELTNEQLIKIAAPRYGIEVSSEDIDQKLRGIARGASETISESEFREWYRQVLIDTGLSDSEFRDYIGTRLLRLRLHKHLAERVSTVAEQVHLHAIVAETYEDTEKIRARWEAGEDFDDLAREVSLDEVSGEKGGDLGWFPRGVLFPGFDRVVFNLNIGDVSQPLLHKPDPKLDEFLFFLLMVSEKADVREVDGAFLLVLKAQALDDWLLEEIRLHEVEWHGLRNGFCSETNAWISWQLARE